MNIFYSMKQIVIGTLLTEVIFSTQLFACTGIKLAAKN